MTNAQRILALDAAVVACGGIDEDPKYRKLQTLLDSVQDELSSILDAEYTGPFRDFLLAQEGAIKALSDSPVVWGGHNAGILFGDYSKKSIQSSK